MSTSSAAPAARAARRAVACQFAEATLIAAPAAASGSQKTLAPGIDAHRRRRERAHQGGGDVRDPLGAGGERIGQLAGHRRGVQRGGAQPRGEGGDRVRQLVESEPERARHLLRHGDVPIHDARRLHMRAADIPPDHRRHRLPPA